MAIEGHTEILGFCGVDGPADRLRAVMEDVNADDFTTWAPDRFQKPRFIHGEQLALG